MPLLQHIQSELTARYGPAHHYSRYGAKEELQDEGGAIPWIYMSLSRQGRSPALVIDSTEGSIPLLTCCYSPGPVHYVCRVARQPVDILKRYGVEVIQGDIERDWHPSGDSNSYGFVVMYRILEHLMFHPLRTLSHVHSLMLPGSYLALATEPSKEVAADDLQFFDPVDLSYDVPTWSDSVSRLYSPDNTVTMLEGAGFEIEELYAGKRLTHILAVRG